MKKKIKIFCEDEYFNFEDLVLAKKKHFEKVFALDGVSFAKLKIDFRKILFLENSGF